METQLIIEIHQMLKRICSYIDKIESTSYKEQEDLRSFNIDVAANLFANKLNNINNENNRN